MSQAPRLERNDRGIWEARWSENRRSKRLSFKTRDDKEAANAFALWMLGRGVDTTAPAGPVPRIDVLWDLYWTKHVSRHEEGQTIAAACWASLKPFFGMSLLSEMTQDKVEQYEAWRAAGNPLRERHTKDGPKMVPYSAGASTVRRELGALLAAINWCADPRRKIIAPAAVPAIALPAEGPGRDRWLTTAEVRALRQTGEALSGAEGRMTRGHRFLWLALETCARRQAILDLTWDRVDFETRTIHYPIPGQRVTKKKRAHAPISAQLLAVLERAKKERVTRWPNGVPRRPDEMYVLDHPGVIEHQIETIARMAGIKGVHPHLLRHTGATHMARRGVPLWNVAGVLCITLATATKVYAHHCPAALVDAVNAISAE